MEQPDRRVDRNLAAEQQMALAALPEAEGRDRRAAAGSTSTGQPQPIAAIEHFPTWRGRTVHHRLPTELPPSACARFAGLNSERGSFRRSGTDQPATLARQVASRAGTSLRFA